MAFDYGKETLGIKNPFKQEGLIDLLTGLIVIVFGVVLLFNVRTEIAQGDKPTAWINLLSAYISCSGNTCANKR